MIEFQEPVPKRFPPKARCQPLPVIVGDWSEETIKNLWPCFIGNLKSNGVVITDENDMQGLHNSGFFGQSAYFDRKKFKHTEHSVKSKRRKKNWDQLIISNSVPNLDACLAEKKSESAGVPEGEKEESNGAENTTNSEEQPAKKRRLSDSCESTEKVENESSPSKSSAFIGDFVDKSEVGKGMMVDVSDSEDEGANEEDEDGDTDGDEASRMLGALDDESNEEVSVRDLDVFSDDKKVLNLNFEEAFFLSYALGCLSVLSENDEVLDYTQLFDIFSKADEDFVYKYVTYHHYRSKGWIVKPGIKFGGDFLLYKQGPPFYHASFIIVINKGNTMSWTTLTGLNRLAGSVNKELIVATISIPAGHTLQNMLAASITETLYRRWVPTSELAPTEN